MYFDKDFHYIHITAGCNLDFKGAGMNFIS